MLAVTSRFATVFLDRDGTLNRKAPEGHYITTPADLQLLPGAADAVRRLNDAGVRVILVSNQRGVALGRLDAAALAAVQRALEAALAERGARLDAVYVCPHDRGGCGCRKPLPGLLLRAAAEQPGVELGRSVMIGDAETDIAAGRAAGTATIRLGPAGTPSAAQHCCPDLAAAVGLILAVADPGAAGEVATVPTRQ